MSSKKSSMTKVKQDQKKHLGERKHICHICMKKFTWKGDLNKHILIHSGDKPFKCETCDKQFNRKGHLNRHLLIHSQKKPFECPTCLKQFNHKESLNRHELIHSGKKPFACSTCSKQFRSKSDLNKHMRIHSQEKAYECLKCLKQFRWRQSYKSHIKYECGEETLKCPTCGKTFTTTSSLYTHVRGVHQKDRSFICDICQKGFTLKCNLRQHQKRHLKKKRDASSSTRSEKYLQRKNLLSDKSKGDAKILCHKLTEHEIKKNTSRGSFELKNKETTDGVELNYSEFPSIRIKEESNKGDELADEPTPSTSYPIDEVKQEAADDVEPTSINLCEHLFVKEEEEVLSYLTST